MYILLICSKMLVEEIFCSEEKVKPIQENTMNKYIIQKLVKRHLRKHYHTNTMTENGTM